MTATLPALLALAAIAAVPPPPSEPGCYQIRAKVEMISLPTGTALRLLPRLKDADRCEAACVELQRLIRAGEAEVLEQPTVVTRDRQRTETDSGPELRWPTEIGPPGIPGSFGNSPDAASRPRQQSWGPITPSAFETDPLGARFEMEPTLERDAQGLILRTSVVASLSTLDGWREFFGPADPHGVVGAFRQPIISRYKVYSAVAFRPGAHKLLGTFTCAQPQPHVILFVLYATATCLDPPPAK